MTVLLYAVREITGRKGRSFAAIAGMSLGIALYVAFGTLSDSYRSLIQLPFSQISVDVTIQRVSSAQAINPGSHIRLPVSNQPIHQNEVENVASLSGIESLSQSLLLWDQSPQGFVTIQGIDLSGPMIGPSKVQEWVVEGSKLGNSNTEIMLEKHFARFHHMKVGDQIVLGGKRFPIVGIVEQKEGSTISAANAYLTIDAARSLANLPAGVSNMLFAQLKRGTDPQTVRKQASRVIPGVVVSSSDNIAGMMKGFNAISGRFSSIMGILSLVFAAIVTYRILVGSVSERAREIGIMKAVGWTRNNIVLTVVTETLIIGLVGGLVGIALGYLGAWALGSLKISLAMPWNLSPVPSGASQMTGLNVYPVSLPVAVSVKTIVVSLAVAAMISGLTGAIVARRLAGLEVMESLRSF
jgi:putative ABC transport system permease protein